jgi:DegV family protein with EDD domain
MAEWSLFMFKVISDSACDILDEYMIKNNATLVPLYVTFDGEHYSKEQHEVDYKDFYNKMLTENCYPKSSLPSVQDYIDAFLPSVKENIPIICICITSLFSGSYNSACNAKNAVLEDYPDAVITVINSTLNSASMALFVHEAIRMNNDNVPYEKAVETLLKMTTLGRIYFTIDSLDYLIKGGRIGKLGSLIGGKIKIKPLIVMKNGEINLGGVSRTRKKALSNVIELCEKHFASNNLSKSDYLFTIGSGIDFEEAAEYRKTVEESLGVKCVESTEYFPTVIGVVTACHTGPKALGVACMPKYETLM